MTDITDPICSITVRQEGDKLLLLADGRLVSVMPYQAALHVAQAIRAKALKAEEYAKAESIVHDNAILQRAGFPMGLSDHPKIIEETKKEIVHNRDLRRYMPKIKTEEIVHAPTIKQQVIGK